MLHLIGDPKDGREVVKTSAGTSLANSEESSAGRKKLKDNNMELILKQDLH
jgi:hypothetical protein